MEEVPDFRKNRGRRYNLHDLLVVSILAFLSGADDFEGIASFAKHKKVFLSGEGLLGAERLPSHDLFRWVFMSLDKTSFAQLLAAWLSCCIERSQLDSSAQISDNTLRAIQIDGKSLRASRSSVPHHAALQVVSAFVGATHLTLDQVIIDDKSCEKNAIPQLLQLLDLKDSVVTIDAIATYKKNAQIIVDKKGDYILALKKNNKMLFEEVQSFFAHFHDTTLIHDSCQQVEQNHGRTESRICKIISQLEYFPEVENWKNLQSIVHIEAQRTSNGKTSLENRYYLSSLPPKACQLQQLIRGHWAIENNLHWVLDVAFNEDKHRLRNKNAAFCCTTLRRFALALIKNANISNDSIKAQRLQIGWDNELLKQYFNIL